MKILQRVFAAMLAIGLVMCAATGCTGNDPGEESGVEQRVYRQAVELGYEGSFEEFMQQVTGKDGKDGASVTAAFVNEEGELIIELSDGNNFNAGIVRGEKGEDGKNGADGKNGTDGKNGADGSVWYCGEGIPSDGLGKESDLYLDTTTYDVYRKSTEWTKMGNIRGGNALQGKVKISYDASSGTFENGESVLSEIVSQGDYASLPVPARENFIFAGWFGGEGASAGKFTSLTPVFGDIILVARWMPQPEISYPASNAFQIAEGELLPAGRAEIAGLYGVCFAECTVNGASDCGNIRYTLVEKSFGRWTVTVESSSAMEIGNYAVTVSLYSEYTKIDVTFRYSVTAAPVHDFSEIILGDTEIAERTIGLDAGDSCELCFRLTSSYGSVSNKITIGEKTFVLSEGDGNTFEEEDFTLIAVVTNEGTDSSIYVNLYFNVSGTFGFTLESEAENGELARAVLRFEIA